MLWWIIVEFIIGCLLLTWGAERFVHGSVQIAHYYRLPKLIVGVVFIGFGTTMPEMLVSILAALHKEPGIAIGNVIGSNIANIGLVIGVTALIAPVIVHGRLLKREFPVLMLFSLLTGFLLWNQYLSRLDGVILLLMLLVYLWLMIKFAKQDRDEIIREVDVTEAGMPKIEKPNAIWLGLIWWLVGLVVLLVSSEVIIMSATDFAKWFDVSTLVVGLTIVAIGTSLPELAAAIMTSIKHQHEMTLGNIIGSNALGLLGVLGFSAVITPSALPSSLLFRDYPIMLGMVVLLWVLPLLTRGQGKIGRISGGLLLLCFVGYLGSVIFTA